MTLKDDYTDGDWVPTAWLNAIATAINNVDRNIDGGNASSVYGGSVVLDGGSASG